MTDDATTDPEEERPTGRPFRDWLGEQGNGALHRELTEALAELIDAVHEHGRPGTLTLALKVSPAGRGGRTVVVSDSVALRAPQPERDTTLFFVDSKNRALTRRDPDQAELPLVEVPRRPTTLKEAQ